MALPTRLGLAAVPNHASMLEYLAEVSKPPGPVNAFDAVAKSASTGAAEVAMYDHQDHVGTLEPLVVMRESAQL